jgi:hypothetical protein
MTDNQSTWNQEAYSSGFKRKREELELLKLEQDIRVRDQEIHAKEHEIKTKEQDLITKVLKEYDRICVSTIIDEQARNIFKQAFLGVITTDVKPLAPLNQEIVNINASKPSLPVTIQEKEVEQISTETKIDEFKEFVNDIEKMIQIKKKKNVFSLKNLLEEMNLKIHKSFMPALGKKICTRFKEKYPGSEIFSKKKTTYFYEKDKKCIEGLVKEEYAQHVIRRSNVQLV